MTCPTIKLTVFVVLVWLLTAAAAASGPPVDDNQAAGARAFIIAASPGTNTSAVQAVLQAAGVWLAPRGSSISALAAAAPHGAAGWALQAGAAAHSVAPLLAQLPPHGHVLHVVQDIRQQLSQLHHPAQLQQAAVAAPAAEAGGARVLASAEHWARTNLGLKAWATQSGLGIARRYSVARMEDLCIPDAAAAETAVRAMLQHAGLVAPASIAALLPSLAQHCPSSSAAAAAAPVLANDSSSGAVLHSALTAFDYKPASPIGLPRWLAAPEAMAELARVAAAWPPGSGPAVVTFVSGGYEPILNNWLAWVKDSGASLASVLVITGTGNVQHVQRKLLFRSVRVIGLDPVEPDGAAVLPGSSEALGRARDPGRHKRARVWLLRVRVMYELVAAGVGVVVSDLDAIWRRDAVADLLARVPAAHPAYGAASGRQGGYDLLMSPGFFPFDIHDQMGVAGCMGFLFARPTPAAQRLLAAMLLEKLGQLQLRHVKFFNDQRVLNEQLLLAAIAVNASALPVSQQQPAHGGAARRSSNLEAVEGAKLSTAPDALQVLFLPDRQYARVCSANATAYADAVVVHCQSHNSGAGKMTFLHDVGLWKEPAAAAAV